MVVFSGFDSVLVEHARASLRSRQIEAVFVKSTATLNHEYFEKLRTRALEVSRRIVEEDDDRIVSLLASCVPKQTEAIEKSTFFPWLRRIKFPVKYRRDINLIGEMLRKLQSVFSSEEFLGTYDFIRPGASAVLSLPLRNSPSRRLSREIEAIFELDAFRPDNSLGKEVVRLRGGRGFRIGVLNFRPAINNAGHPVRRCTDSDACDAAAFYRLGFSLPARFEFDVTADAGVAGREFWLCDGASSVAPSWATHLNMRVNDDHKFG
jgi:hypothetical protein